MSPVDTRSMSGASAEPPGRMNAAAVTRSGLWRVIEALASEGLTLLFFVALARLLVPEQFGAVALSTSIVSVLQIVLNSGFAVALIQHPAPDEAHLRTAFAANLLIATAMVVACLMVAWPLAWLLDRPPFAPLLMAMAPMLWLNALSAPLQGLLRRRMAYRQLALRSVVAALCGGAAATALAFAGAGVWALVAQQWVTFAAGLAVLLSVAPARPWPLRLDRPALAELLPVARPVMFGQVASSAARRLNLVALGLFLADRDIGLMFLILRLIFSVEMVTQFSLSDVSLSVFSRLQHDRAAFGRAVGSALLVAAVAGSACFGALSVLAEPVVPRVFGAAWSGAVGPLSILALLSVVVPITQIATQAILATGRGRAFGWMASGFALLQLLVAMLGATFGLREAVLAYGAVHFLHLAVALMLLGPSLDAPLPRLVGPCLSAVTVPLLSLLTLDAWLPAHGPEHVLMVFAAYIAVCAAVAAVFLRGELAMLGRVRRSVA